MSFTDILLLYHTTAIEHVTISKKEPKAFWYKKIPYSHET